MESSYSTKRAVMAMLLVIVLTFSVPVHIAAPKTATIGSAPLAQNGDNNTVLLDAADTSEKNTVTLPEISPDDKYKEEETMPGKDTVLSPDDILPDDDSSITETDEGYTEKEGVTVIPATLNNIMRDNLPSIISKKAYTFSLSSRGAILYAFNHVDLTEQNCLWYITLYEEYSPDGTGKTVDYRVLNRVSYESIGTNVQSSAIGVLPGNYRIEVECISGYTDDKYSLLIGFSETSYYETEPNNTNSRYNELSLNKTINGSASVYPSDEADADCYLFRITEVGYTVLYFEHEADDTASSKDNVAWRITLTDEKGNEYFYTSSTMEKAMINSGIMGLPPGYYFVTVNSHIYSSLSYSLNISFTEDSAIETELNETPETANPIEINTEKVGSLTSRFNVSDRDYFSFTMENDGFIVLDFIHEATTEQNNGWNVSVLSSDGRTIFSSVSDWSQAILQSPNIGLTAGDYFIKIDSDNLYHSNMVYRLILLTVQNTNWETEPNNTPADADILQIGSTINGTMIETGVDYDRDWFLITAEEETELNISFGHIKTDEANKEGWTVSLLDNNGNVLKTMSSDWNEEEKSMSAKIVPGSYYILIETGLFFNSSRYILSVN